MKNRKVLNLRTHLGGLYGKTSYDSKRDDVEMEIWPVGVYIKSIKGKYAGVLVPYPNCVEVQLEPEVIEVDGPQPTVFPDEVKRGPGRPSGPRAA